jgi:hypothetical protein
VKKIKIGDFEAEIEPAEVKKVAEQAAKSVGEIPAPEIQPAVHGRRARRCWSFTPDGSANGPSARYVHDPDSRGIGAVRYPRRVPNCNEAARELAKRTLTNLYNQRPTWLALAHQKLDSAVFAAYGWPDSLTDDEILERLLSLNLHRIRPG